MYKRQALPVVNDTLTQQDQTLHPNISVLDLFTPNALLWFVPLVLGVIFFAGFYPSWVLSGFNPIKALAGRLTRAKGGLTIRRTLITGQFLLTQLFLIVVSVSYTHLDVYKRQLLIQNHFIKFCIQRTRLHIINRYLVEPNADETIPRQ